MKTKTAVISLPKAVRGAHCAKDIELDAVIPDFSPDISRLVRIDASPYVESVRCGEQCEISGRMIVGMLYESDYKSKLAYATFNVPFELKCDIGVSGGTVYPEVKCECTYLTCRLLGQRKASVKAKVEADVSGTEMCDYDTAEPDGSDLNTFFRLGSIAANVPKTKLNSVFDMKENFKIDRPAASVVCASASMGPAEAEVYDMAAELKAKLTVRLLCEMPDGGYETFTDVIPADVTVSDDAIKAGYTVDAELVCADLSAVTDLDEYGESKVINIRYSLRASGICRGAETYTFASDAFSRRYSCECAHTDAICDSRVPQAGKTISAERSYSSEDGISEILGADTTFELTDTKAENGALRIKGKVKTDVLARSGESIVSRTFSDDFEDSVPYSGTAVPTVSRIIPFDTKAELYGSSLNVRTMAFVKLTADERSNASLLSAMETGDEAEAASGGFRFYYPDGSEELWDIAKKYRVNPKKLTDDNRDGVDDAGKLKAGRRYICIK